MGTFKKPGKINAVSMLMMALLVCGAYAGFKFGPPYYRKFKAKGILDEAAFKFLAKSYSEELRGKLARQQEDIVERALRDLGVLDTALRVSVNGDGHSVTVTAMYTETVRHPFGKISRIAMAPSVTRQKAKAQW